MKATVRNDKYYLPKSDEVVIKYWKYGNTLNPSFTRVNGTYTDGVFTGADGAKMMLPVLPLGSANSWEIQIPYTHRGGGQYPTIIAPNTQTYGVVLTTVSNKPTLSLSSSTTTTNIDSGTTLNLTMVAGNKYYFKYGFTGSQYYVDYNTDDSDNYTRLWSINNTTKVIANDPLVLLEWGWHNATRYNTGSIDMKKFKVFINGDVYLTGTLLEESDSSDYDFITEEKVYYAINL